MYLRSQLRKASQNPMAPGSLLLSPDPEREREREREEAGPAPVAAKKAEGIERGPAMGLIASGRGGGVFGGGPPVTARVYFIWRAEGDAAWMGRGTRG